MTQTPLRTTQTPPRLLIHVKPDQEIGTINRNIFGHFVEHMGRAIYGGVYDPDSPRVDERGFRRDVVDAMKRLGVPNLRWPGGNFASSYHWEDGIGPRARRVPRLDLAWRAYEPNTFGTDEYIEYARKLGAAPYICVNTGTGSFEEAARWVEYCNISSKEFPTHDALRREQNGHPEPYGVKLWGVGNEVYGQWQAGYASPQGYAGKCREFAHFMRAVDPSIKIVAVGADREAWDRAVLRTAGDAFDYISIHQYHGQPDYFATVGAAAYVERRLMMLADEIDGAMKVLHRATPIQIAMDEWNVCDVAWGTGDVLPEPVPGEYFEVWDQKFALKDALFAAGVFHAMFRQCRHVTLANLAQMVNANGMLTTTTDDLLLTPIYHVFDLYANHSGPTAVRTSVAAREGTVPSFTAEDWRQPSPQYIGLRAPFLRFSLRDVPFLEAQATLSQDRRTLYVAVVNYHPDEAIAAVFDFDGLRVHGAVRVAELNGEDTNTVATFEQRNVARLTLGELALPLDSYAFPAHSATVLECTCEPPS
ncbi:MAG: alpha-N-arabinofuranosidase [Chloroflexi bacterium]|nr:alpha-N-arabinofuranosidase [Chloroflexota bacterium]